MDALKEFERIVEYSYLPKARRFVIRFLDGSSYILNIDDLPKKLQTKKPDWENTHLTRNQDSLVVMANNEQREIPAFMIHAKGTKAN